MTARLFVFLVLTAAISIAYVLFAARYLPETWPWLLRAYALPAAACVFAGFALRVWRDGSFVAHAFAWLACFAFPAAALGGLLSMMCALDTGLCS